MEKIECFIEEARKNHAILLGPTVNPVVVVAEVAVVVAVDHIELVVAEDIHLLLHHTTTH